MSAAILAEIIGPDLLIVLVLALILFGGAKLPKLARSLGSAKSEFEKGLREGDLAAHSAPAAAPDEATVTMTRREYEELLAAERRAHDKGQATPPAADA